MHEAELLAAIRANPDDDAPRMLYADALLDRGDDRGQYIQLALKGRYHDWLHANSTRIESAWQAELGCANSNPFVTFRRGFPFLIGGSVAAIAKVHDVIATYPITVLAPWGMTSFAPLAALEELRFIRELEVNDLDKKPIAPSVIGEVIAAPYLAPVRLATGQTLSDDGARVWAKAPWLERLESFQVWKAPVTGAGLAAMRMPALRELRISELSLGDLGAEAFAQIATLERAHLASCHIGEAGGRAVLGALDHVVELTAADNAFGAGVRGLVRAPQLRELDLSNNALASHAAALAQAELPVLVKLMLGSNRLTVEAVAAFASSSLPSLQHLDLTANELGFAGVAPFETFTGLPALAVLGLRNNGLSSGKTQTIEGGDEWNPWSTTIDIELAAEEIATRLKLRAGITVF